MLMHIICSHKIRWAESKDLCCFCHDMAKVKVGVPAISRYHQIKHFFPEKDGPVLNDHDFPMPSYLISVSKHMFLQDEERIDVSYNESNSYAVEALSGYEPDFQKMTFDDLYYSQPPGAYSMEPKNVTYRLQRCDKKGNERMLSQEHKNN